VFLVEQANFDKKHYFSCNTANEKKKKNDFFFALDIATMEDNQRVSCNYVAERKILKMNDAP
jgi:hypothetical protein